jgi:hypothetical protein
MAGRGLPPRATKHRRNKEPIEKRTLEVDDEVRGPALPPDVRPQGEDWHPGTAAWWQTWRRSAQAQARGRIASTMRREAGARRVPGASRDRQGETRR